METAAGKHRFERIRSKGGRRGRHAAPRAPFPWATTIRNAPVVVALAIVFAVVTIVGLPRATSNASSGQDDSADAEEAPVALVVGTSGSSLICPIDWRQSTWHVKKLIRCAAEYYGIWPRKALYIAWRESRYRPSAYNEAGDAAGIYQHVLKYWPERAETYGFAGWSAFNARANIIVTMQMVRRIGWSPWAV